MARITHPHPELGTTLPQVGGVVFRDGVADVDLTDKPNLEAYYRQHGYGIEYDAVPLENLTVRELRDVAATEDVEVPARATKAEIIDLINATPAVTLTDLEQVAEAGQALPTVEE